MANFIKAISVNDYCQGGTTVHTPNSNMSKTDRCQNSILGDDFDDRFDDTQYYGKKTTPPVSTSAWSSAFGSAFG